MNEKMKNGTPKNDNNFLSLIFFFSVSKFSINKFTLD